MNPSQTSARPPAIPVGELTRRIKGLLESSFRQVWVEGEIGRIKVHHSGHVYFTLKDADARINGVVWRKAEWRMRYKPNEGDRVIARGTLSVYPPRGDYSLSVDLFLPAGAGDLQAAFEQLKRRLASAGLFAPERKRPIPWLPRAVGVVTSATSAAFQDIRSVLHRRSPQIPIVLYPAQVQGDGAVDDVIRGLDMLTFDPRVDVIIVGRGGGSLEDLWTFNDERLARAIAACRVPVISAVGHETDVTIADLVADVRAATPTEAAERAVPNRSDLLYTLDGLTERLARAAAVSLERAGTRLARGVDRLDAVVRRQTDTAHTRLARLDAALRDHHPLARISQARRRIDQAQARLAALGPERVERARRRLDRATEALERLPLVDPRRAALRLLIARLEGLSPLSALARGYSITRRGKSIVRQADEVAVGDEIEVRLHRGRLAARVLGVHPPMERTDEQ